MAPQLLRNFVKDCLDLPLIVHGVLVDITTVQVQNPSFHCVDSRKIMRCHVFLDSLWHSTHEQILSETVHSLPVKRLPHRPSFLEVHDDFIVQQLLVNSPHEFFEIHGIHA